MAQNKLHVVRVGAEEEKILKSLVIWPRRAPKTRDSPSEPEPEPNSHFEEEEKFQGPHRNSRTPNTSLTLGSIPLCPADIRFWANVN